MDPFLQRIALMAILAASSGLQPAHADIYTWTDGSGVVNVSNEAPPDGVRVQKVTHTSPQAMARADAAREAARQAEAAALAERVRQLEEEVQLATRAAPPQVVYRAAPPPPTVQYVPVPMPAPYAMNPAPAPYAPCDAWLTECGL